MADIDNSEDILNSRDIEDRIEELEAERAALESDLEEAKSDLEDSGPGATADEEAADFEKVKAAMLTLKHWNDENGEELAALKAFRDELEPYVPDWHHGETIIRDSYFKEYAQELAEDTGMIKSDLAWPYTCIDWNKAARELQMDYTSAEFDGVTYWAR